MRDALLWCVCVLWQVVAEDAVASEVLEADEYDAANLDSLAYARGVAERAVEAAATAKVGGQGRGCGSGQSLCTASHLPACPV